MRGPRTHIYLGVEDVNQSALFYEALLGGPPASRETDITVFEFDAPPLVLTIASRSGRVGARTPRTVRAGRARSRSTSARRPSRCGGRARACGLQDEGIEARDPDGNTWKVRFVPSAKARSVVPDPRGGRRRAMKDDSRTPAAFRVLLAICFCHLINDMLQSLLVASYPTLKAEFHLSFAQIGLVTLAYQLTASLLQPVVGLYADRRPMPFSLPAGTLFTFAGLLVMATAATLRRPRSRSMRPRNRLFRLSPGVVARGPHGGRRTPRPRAVPLPGGRKRGVGARTRWPPRSSSCAGAGAGMGAFSSVALVSTCVLAGVGLWYRRHGLQRLGAAGAAQGDVAPHGGSLGGARSSLDRRAPGCSSSRSSSTSPASRATTRSISCIASAFPSRARRCISSCSSRPRPGGRSPAVRWETASAASRSSGSRSSASFPFTLALPHADLAWTRVLSVIIGFVLASAFPAIVVYGQELIPGRVGLVAGLFFGLSFGAAGLGAALMGRLADATSVETVYRLCAVAAGDGSARRRFLPGHRPAVRAPGARGPTFARAVTTWPSFSRFARRARISACMWSTFSCMCAISSSAFRFTSYSMSLRTRSRATWRFWLRSTKTERMMASSETTIVSRPNGNGSQSPSRRVLERPDVERDPDEEDAAVDEEKRQAPAELGDPVGRLHHGRPVVDRPRR